MQNESLSRVFNLPPEEIINYFKDKGLKTSFDWHEVYADCHAKAFTVAKMTDVELLSDTKKLLEKTIKEGKSHSSFKSEAKELFERKGWVGFKEVKDPKTGEIKTVELGTPNRIKKIYDCNMRSAYAVGRYKEQLEEIDVAPYWQYVAILDESTRPQHRELNGKVFKADDPFWTNFYPPNGWNCRCFVKNLTKRQVERLGLKVENSKGHISSVNQVVGGEEKEIPVYHYENAGKVYTLKPDAGWETNLGVKAWGIDIQAWNKIDNMPDKIKYDFISKMASNPHRKESYVKWAEGIFKQGFSKTTSEKTLTWIMPKIYQKINNAKVYLDESSPLSSAALSRTLKSPIVVIQDSQIGHSGLNKNPKQALSKEEYLSIYEIVNNPDEIYEDYTNPKWQQIAFVRLIPDSDMCIKVCVRFNQKSKSKDKDYLISRVTTVGKVNYYNLSTGKEYKKIE